MIKEFTKNEEETIELLESSFSNTFKKNELKSRFLNNIFTKGFIYLEESNIIGYVVYDAIYERFEIINIEVKKEHRNKKIGTSLLEKVIDEAKKQSVRNITLEVKISNEAAIHLYKKTGFVSVAIRKNYYDNEDGILMEMKW